MMASISDKYYQFLLAQGLCSGIGTAMLFYPTISCLVTWFLKKRATAIGIAASGSGLGGILYPIIVREGLNNIGFGWTMRTCAFLSLFLGAVTCLVTTSRLPPTPKKVAPGDFTSNFKDVTFVLVAAAGPVGFLGLWIV